MAPEILSRQASPVDGLLSSLKSANLVFFGFPYVSVADVNPIYRIGRRVDIFSQGTRAAVRISALIQIVHLTLFLDVLADFKMGHMH